MMDLILDPAVVASFLSLAVLEIILGVDNVVFISIAASRLPEHQRHRARLIGLSLGLAMRIMLLLSISWIVSLTRPILTLSGFEASWRDIILIAGGLFLLWKASAEIFREVESGEISVRRQAATMTGVIGQIVIVDIVFSVDSVITAVGIADHVEVMIAAIIVAVIVMMVASEPVSAFVEAHPSAKMLTLAFLVMVGAVLIADGLHQHIDRKIIYAAIFFAGSVEALNLLRAKRASRRRTGSVP